LQSVMNWVSATKATYLREHERLVQRYEHWQKLRDIAIAKVGPSKVELIKKMEFPEPPPPLDESEIADVSIDMSQAAIEAEVTHQELDLGGIERVPDADPGLDVSFSKIL
jgi:serine/threonine-protein phosphatase 2A regulatory subunit B'